MLVPTIIGRLFLVLLLDGGHDLLLVIEAEQDRAEDAERDGDEAD